MDLNKLVLENVNWFEANPDLQYGYAMACISTFLKPPRKKVKHDNRENAEILESIHVLSGKHEETFRKIFISP